MEQVALAASRRDTAGTRIARRARRTGQIPAVVYGHGKASLPISVDQKALQKAFRTKAGSNAIITLKIEGAKRAEERTVIVKELQYDVVHGRLLHVDFHQISLKDRIKVGVPIALKGDAVGVKQDGGVLEHFLRELEIECLPTEIPPSLELDISALKIGDTVHVKDIAAPSGVKILHDAEGVVLSVLPPHVEKAPEPLAEAPTEPELIRKKKEEEGEEEAAAAEEPAKAEKAPEPKKEGK